MVDRSKPAEVEKSNGREQSKKQNQASDVKDNNAKRLKEWLTYKQTGIENKSEREGSSQDLTENCHAKAYRKGGCSLKTTQALTPRGREVSLREHGTLSSDNFGLKLENAQPNVSGYRLQGRMCQ